MTQDPSCFLSHLNIRAKIVLNVFKEFFTFKDIQRLYRIRLLVAMAIGRHLLLFKLGPLTPHEVCSGALTLHPGLELRAKKMRQTWSHVLCWSLCLPIYSVFENGGEKKTGKKNSWSLWNMSNPFAIALQNMSLGAFPPTSLMRLELAAN